MFRRHRFENLEPRQMLFASPVGDEFLINDQIRGLQDIDADSQALAALPDGGFVAAYSGRGDQDLQGIYVRRFTIDATDPNNVTALGPAELVNTKVQGDQTNPAIASFADGSFVVTWQGRGLGDKHGIFAQWYDSDGNKDGTETLINTTVGGRQFDPQVVTSANGNTIFTWHGVGSGDFNGVFTRVFDDQRNPQPSELLVNTETDDEQAYAAVATDSESNFLVTWSSRHQDGSDWGIFGQRFNESGTAVGDEFMVNQSVTGSQHQSSITSLNNDDYVVAWTSRTSAVTDSDIVARRVSDAAQPVGDEFVINDGNSAIERDVALAATPSGGFLAAWTSGGSDGAGWESVGREFDSSNTALDEAFALNNETSGANSGHQEKPNIIVSGGQSIVAWSGNGQEDHQGVHSQRFTVNLSPQIEEIDTQQATVGAELVVTVTATDPNEGDILTFQLDEDDSPEGAVLVQIDNNTAEVRWTPVDDDLPGPAMFRVLVTDNGTPPLSDSEDFLVEITAAAVS